MVTEAECQRTIVDACKVLGYRVHHCRPAWSARGYRTPIQGHPGFVDLVIAGHGRVFCVELKRPGNKVTDDQQAWLDALATAGVCSGVVTVPDGQQKFIDLLAEFARPRGDPDGYKRARGAIKGTEPAEVIIRRLRGES